MVAVDERDAFRKNLVERLDQGVEVEEGPLTAHIYLVARHYQPTRLRLIEALGEKAVEKIRKKLESKRCWVVDLLLGEE